MKLTIEINLDNSAFVDHDTIYEVKRILQNVCEHVHSSQETFINSSSETGILPIHDINGNNVGFVKWSGSSVRADTNNHDNELEKTFEIIKGNTGLKEIAPKFFVDNCFFYPIPQSLQMCVEEGDIVTGYFGKKHDTGRYTSTGLKIHVRYFIPTKIVS